jgi:pimeloyl-ACP methyl ester carboxylesterase
MSDHLEVIEREIFHLPSGAALYFEVADSESHDESPTVLVVHGWSSLVFSSTYEKLCDALHQQGFNTASLSLRGHRFADGDIQRVTRADHEQDIAEAVRHLQNHPFVDPQKISAVGASYGAYMLANASCSGSFQNLVFRAPALYPDEGWDEPSASVCNQHNLLSWRQKLHEPEEVRVLKRLSQFHGGLLIVLSELDEQMPRAIAVSYTKALMSNRAMVTTVPDAGHQLVGDQRGQFAHIVQRWLAANP